MNKALPPLRNPKTPEVFEGLISLVEHQERRLTELEALVKTLRQNVGGNDLSGHGLASLGWVSTVVVTPTGQNTISWTAGTVTLSDGRTQAILTGTYTLLTAEFHAILYVDWGNSTLQVTQTIANAIGANKIPIAMADSLNSDASDYAHVQNFKGTGFMNQITLNQNAVRTAKILNSNVTYAKIQNVVDDRLLGNSSGAPAAPSEISYGTTPSTQAFGDAAAAGTTKQPERAGHKHAMPAQSAIDHGSISGLTDDDHTQYLKEEASGGLASEIPDHTHVDVTQAGTVAHGALTGLTAGDDHTQYRLESADHTHQSTGLQGGKLDHGLALDGLTDDDHTQYIKHALATAANDFLVASGSGAFVKKTLAETLAILAHTLNSHTTGYLRLPGGTELTLDSAGDIVVTGSKHYVDTYADAATDNLDTITGGAEGYIVILGAQDVSRVVTVRHQGAIGAGSLHLKNGQNFVLDSYTKFIVLQYAAGTGGGAWSEIGRSDSTTGEVTNGDDHDHSGGDGADLSCAAAQSLPANSLGTVYTNTGAGALIVTVTVTLTDGASAIAYCDTAATPTTLVAQAYQGGTSGVYIPMTFVVPEGWKYRVIQSVATVTILEWVENALTVAPA